MAYNKATIDIISMGCSKNLVDSEQLINRLQNMGYALRHNPDDVNAEYVVVNTCGFIADAKEESIDLILNLCELKKHETIGKLVVMGCLSQRYMDELQQEIPEVDIWYGKFDWKDFIQKLPELKESDSEIKPWMRRLTTPKASAFLKISEGCNRFCAFCAIPIITGRHTSRPIEEILTEVEWLVGQGVKEFNVIAQDLSSYGIDLYGSQKLAELVDKISEIKGVEWIRLHYAYPAEFPMDLLDVMARKDNVCKYIDIALQHIADPVLANMRRHINAEQTRQLIAEMRRKVPGIRIRTTLMVGFPGEDEKSFQELLDFVKETRFDRMGAFAYCEEDDTWAARNLEDVIPEHIKQERLSRLMKVQEDISMELQEKMIGNKLRVLIDHYEGDTAIARSEYDSPDVDTEILINGIDVPEGEFVDVIVKEAYPFELIAEIDGR